MADLITKAEIFARLEARRSVFSELHAEMSIDQDFDEWSTTFQSGIGARYLKGMPAGFVPKFIPIAKMGVNIGLNNLLPGERPRIIVHNPPSRHYEDPEAARADRKKRSEQKRALESALGMLRYQLNTYTIEDPSRDFVRKALALGAGIMHYAIDDERWTDPPFGWLETSAAQGQRHPDMGRTQRDAAEVRRWQQKRQRAIPFTVRSVHPRTVFWDPSHDPPRDFILEEDILRDDAAREHGGKVETVAQMGAQLGQDAPSGLTGATVKRVCYYSEDAIAVYIDGEPVLGAEDGANEDGVAENTAGVPYLRMALGGFGDRDHQGNWVRRCVGLIRDARDAVVRKIVIQNLKDAVAQVGAFPVLEVIIQNGEALTDIGLHADPFVNAPNAEWRHDDTVRGQFMEPPQLPRWLDEMEARADRDLEILFGPEIGRGIREAGETAAGQQQRASIAQAPYRPAKQACQQAEAAMLLDLCFLIKHELRESVWAGGLQLRPDMIPDGPFMIEVDYSPPSDEEKAVLRMQAAEDLANFTLSREDYLRETRDEQEPQEKLIEIDADRVLALLLADPDIMGVMKQGFMMEHAPPAPAPVPGMAGGGMGPPGGVPMPMNGAAPAIPSGLPTGPPGMMGGY